ncbi:hypothetical protein ACVDG8_024170 [Mesorhizobium sp. ORM8.1]
MERGYIPRLAEEEAKVLVLRALFHAKKGQLTSTEIKKIAPKYRKMSDEDMKPKDNRSGAPTFHQIVQNAFDRMDKTVGVYRTSFAMEISEPLGRVIRITDDGKDFVLDFPAS